MKGHQHPFQYDDNPQILASSGQHPIADMIQTTFFKCTNWQLEETLDPINCPYHYYCNHTYPGNYSRAVDLFVVAFIVCSFLITFIFMVIEIVITRYASSSSSSSSGNWRHRIIRARRYLIPSSPVSMPIMLLILAKGSRINNTDLFPLIITGPAILQLVRVSSLAFDDNDNTIFSDIKYVFLESSTISGILHLSLYLDSVILPFYTGLDALISSRFSGECASCVCRDKVLVVGGSIVLFRGWSVTNASVIGALCLRVFSRISTGGKEKVKVLKNMLEVLSWVLIGAECFYLAVIIPSGLARSWPVELVCYGGVSVLIILYVVQRLCARIATSRRDLSSNQNSKGKV